MTPKEKAEILVEKFMPYSDYMECDIFTQRENQFKNAKECALICVDEIIKNEDECDIVWVSENYNEWQEVKKEIECL